MRAFLETRRQSINQSGQLEQWGHDDQRRQKELDKKAPRRAELIAIRPKGQSRAGIPVHGVDMQSDEAGRCLAVFPENGGDQFPLVGIGRAWFTRHRGVVWRFWCSGVHMVLSRMDDFSPADVPWRMGAESQHIDAHDRAAWIRRLRSLN
jgi:hypothetical protein